MLGNPMRAAALGILTLLAFACSQPGPAGSAKASPGPTPTASGSSPSPSASAPALTESYGVLGTSGVDQPNYSLAIVGAGGKVAATATAAPRSGLQCTGPPAAGPILPFATVSMSDSRVYYLDGNTSVKFLRPDGTLGDATSVPGNGSLGSTFAVSPDDKRIAVVATDYGKNPVSYRIYVEDTFGGGNHVDIFSAADSRVPWAVGWRSGQLVLGIAGSCSQGGGPFSVFPHEYHVVDPATAARSATLGSSTGCPTVSLPSPGGVLCQEPNGTIDVVGWDGKVVRTFPAYANNQFFNFALAPGGGEAAGCCTPDGSPLLTRVGANPTQVPGGGDTVGFIDDGHLLIGAVAVQSQSRVYTVSPSASTPVPALGFFVGRLPGGLDPGHGT